MSNKIHSQAKTTKTTSLSDLERGLVRSAIQGQALSEIDINPFVEFTRGKVQNWDRVRSWAEYDNHKGNKEVRIAVRGKHICSVSNVPDVLRHRAASVIA